MFQGVHKYALNCEHRTNVAAAPRLCKSAVIRLAMSGGCDMASLITADLHSLSGKNMHMTAVNTVSTCI